MTRKDLMKYFKSPIEVAEAAGIGRSAVYQWKMDEPVPELSLRRLKDYIGKHDLKPIYGSNYQKLKDEYKRLSKVEQAIHAYDTPAGNKENKLITQDD